MSWNDTLCLSLLSYLLLSTGFPFSHRLLTSGEDQEATLSCAGWFVLSFVVSGAVEGFDKGWRCEEEASSRGVGAEVGMRVPMVSILSWALMAGSPTCGSEVSNQA